MHLPGTFNADNCHIAPLGTTQSTRPPSPAKRSGYTARRVTGIIQGLCGVAAIVIAVVLLSLWYDDDALYSYMYRQFESRLAGLIMGVAFIVAAVMGILSKKSKAMISLYMVFSIVACVVACCGLLAVGHGIGNNVQLKHNPQCDIDYHSASYRCCIDRHYYYCGNQYNYRSDSNQIAAEDMYDSSKCVAFRDFYERCSIKSVKISKTLIAFYVLLLIVSIVGGIIAIIGASFTCTGLDCCKGTTMPRTQIVYYQAQQYPPQMLGQGLPVTYIGQPMPPPQHQQMVSPGVINAIPNAAVPQKEAPPYNQVVSMPPAYTG